MNIPVLPCQSNTASKHKFGERWYGVAVFKLLRFGSGAPGTAYPNAYL